MKNQQTKWIASLVMLWCITLFSSSGLRAQSCCGPCTIPGSELITNGNFTAGNTGFQSGHLFQTGIFGGSGQYGIQTSPTICNPTWNACGDHTSGTGNMMVVDGSGNLSLEVWRTPVGTPIVVQPNTTYCFRFFATPVNGTSPPQLYAEFNGTAVGGTLNLTGVNPCTWQPHTVTWNSGSNTSVNIRIRNSNPATGGNDFAIDDISMTSCTPLVTANAGPDTTICAGSRVNLPVPAKGSWRYKVLSGDSTNLSGNIACPGYTTTYVLTVIDDSSCCKAYDTVVITTQFCCPACTVPGSNLITNGDFETGDTSGFDSDHAFKPAQFTSSDQFGIHASPKGSNTSWSNCSDHTPTGSGFMMVVDGFDESNKDVWRTLGAGINVLPNTSYTFRFFATPVNAETSQAKLFVQFNGTTVGGTLNLNPADTCTWKSLTVIWNSGSNTNVNIRIRNTETAGVGNDFAIDDITFIGCVPVITANAGPDTAICYGGRVALPIPSKGTWSYKVLTGDTTAKNLGGNIACPGFTTKYLLTVIDEATGCKAYDTVVVRTKYCCNVSDCFAQKNLVTNGNFEKDTVDWTSDYTLDTVLSPGHGGVIKDASTLMYGGGFTEGIDHTYGDSTGKFLFIDGHCDPIGCFPPGLAAPNKTWCKTVTVKPNTWYDFSAWIMNIQDTTPNNNMDTPVVQLRVNGQLICNPVAYPKQNWPNKWQMQACPWNSGTVSGNIEICIMMMVNGYSGVDIGIDDICFVPRQPDAGPDLTICKGDSVVLPVDTSFTWSYRVLTGDMGSLSAGRIAKPKVTSTYLYTVIDPTKPWCTVIDTVKIVVKKCCQCDSCSIPGADLIINGDFEGGNVGFSSQYTYQGSGNGHYFVGPSSGAVGLGNKFGNGGNFLFADGSDTINRYVWRQPVVVKPGKKYVFCFDYIDLTINDPNHPQINLRINGVSQITVVPTSMDPWGSASITWFSGAATVANIEFYDNSTEWAGNDFGIDNISFRECTPKVTANAGPDTTICLGGTATLGIPPAPYTWNYQVISVAFPYGLNTNVVSPTTRTVYVLEVTDPVTGCKAYDTVVVNVICCFCTNQSNPTGNLITNGDFTAGNTGFTSAYTYGGITSGGSGTYWVQPLSTPFNSSWNKSGNTGNFLFADGATASNTIVWSQTVTVQPNKMYSFCTDLINLNQAPGYPAVNDPSLVIRVNGTQVASVTVDELNSWTPMSASWNSGANTSATLDILSVKTTSTGNDFGVDNIRFVPCDEPPASMVFKGPASGNNIDTKYDASTKVSVYPNPAGTELNVRLSEGVGQVNQLRILDMSGKTVKTIPSDLKGGGVLLISVAELPAGVYTIGLYNAKGCVGKQLFMKQ